MDKLSLIGFYYNCYTCSHELRTIPFWEAYAMIVDGKIDEVYEIVVADIEKLMKKPQNVEQTEYCLEKGKRYLNGECY